VNITTLRVKMSDQKPGPIAVTYVNRLSCQMLYCSQTSRLHCIWLRI